MRDLEALHKKEEHMNDRAQMNPRRMIPGETNHEWSASKYSSTHNAYICALRRMEVPEWRIGMKFGRCTVSDFLKRAVSNAKQVTTERFTKQDHIGCSLTKSAGLLRVPSFQDHLPLQ